MEMFLWQNHMMFTFLSYAILYVFVIMFLTLMTAISY